jgi:polyvinyl alcohol dehydrogenase (cytochrome)
MMHKTRKLIAVAGALLAAASGTVALALSPAADAAPLCATSGTGGDWTTFGHDLSNTRRQPAEATIGVGNVGRLTKRWVFVPPDGGASPFNTTPTEAGGCVFVGTGSGWVYALDANTGAIQWRHQFAVSAPGAGGAIVGAITVAAGKAFVLLNETADGTGTGPYAAALDMHTGALAWQSVPLETHTGSYTNASPVYYNGLVLAGWSPSEGDSTGQGGVDLLNATTGTLVRKVYTIPPTRQAQGFAGGGIWDSPAVDSAGYAYTGTSNPYSKTIEDPNTNAILKIDVDQARPTFGQIVGVYKGNIDQYTSILEGLAKSPLCTETTAVFENQFIDDPICGQLDLDFGASPNLFNVLGVQYVGELQKAGVYHTVRTSNMTKKWSHIVGTPCAVCNASATATGNGQIYGEGTLGGFAFKLNQANGNLAAFTPVLDAIHYQSFSTANGVVYTVDSLGFLDVFNAQNGLLLARRPLLLDSGQLVVALSSTGVAIARHHVFVEVGSLNAGSTVPAPQNGYVIAYSN